MYCIQYLWVHIISGNEKNEHYCRNINRTMHNLPTPASTGGCCNSCAPWYCCPGAHSTDDISLAVLVLWKHHFIWILILIKQKWPQLFVQAMTAVLSCHVQKFEAIWIWTELKESTLSCSLIHVRIILLWNATGCKMSCQGWHKGI